MKFVTITPELWEEYRAGVRKLLEAADRIAEEVNKKGTLQPEENKALFNELANHLQESSEGLLRMMRAPDSAVQPTDLLHATHEESKKLQGKYALKFSEVNKWAMDEREKVTEKYRENLSDVDFESEQYLAIQERKDKELKQIDEEEQKKLEEVAKEKWDEHNAIWDRGRSNLGTL